MRKRISASRGTAARILAGLSVVFTVSGCGLGGPAHGPPASGVAAVVDMGFESYSPADVTVRSGDTVEWRNTSPITHTVTDDPSRAKKPGDASLPPGAPSFDSGDITAGKIYMQTFTIPGTYRYFCTHHENDGMVGTVVVKPPL
jgi:plastocyanin